MSYSVQFLPVAARQLRKIEQPDRKRLKRAIKQLEENPRPAGVKKLASKEKLLRVRVGDYRVVYQVIDREVLVLIIKVGHRREVYRQ